MRFSTIRIAAKAGIGQYQLMLNNDKLTCDMSEGCQNQVTHIGSKGYVYCTTCAPERRGYERTRKMRAWEIKLLLAGDVLPSYKPLPRSSV